MQRNERKEISCFVIKKPLLGFHPKPQTLFALTQKVFKKVKAVPACARKTSV
jgi:hypothetical protein